jgi:hypothetical protein
MFAHSAFAGPLAVKSYEDALWPEAMNDQVDERLTVRPRVRRSAVQLQ